MKTYILGLASLLWLAPSWNVFTPVQSKPQAAESRAAQEKRRKLEAATVAFVQPGLRDTERDFNQRGENSGPVLEQGRYGRRAKSWFSFDVPVDSAHPMRLVVSYSRGEAQN